MAVFTPSGPLRQKVNVEQRSTSQDSLGGQATSWTVVAADVPCSIHPMSGREMMAAQALRAEVMHIVTMRYTPIFATPVAGAALRLNYGGRLLNILNVQNVEERNRQLVLTCQEGLNNG